MVCGVGSLDFVQTILSSKYILVLENLTTNECVGLQYNVSQGSGCQLNGQNCYIEVTLGCPRSCSDKTLQANSDSIKNLPKHNSAKSVSVGRSDQKGSPDHLSVCEKAFIYPAEAVLFHVLRTSFSRSSLRRYFKFCAN